MWDQYDTELSSLTNLGKDKAELIFEGLQKQETRLRDIIKLNNTEDKNMASRENELFRKIL
jgi:hypothetical protein